MKAIFCRRGVGLRLAANFLSAFGGGTILAKAMAVVGNVPFLKGGSLTAFLVGSTIALGVFSLVPSEKRRGKSYLASALVVLFQGVLLSLFLTASRDGTIGGWLGLLFFSVLCLRFACWFVARVFRAADIATTGGKVSWMELAYSVGIILGIAVWNRSPIQISLASLILIDVVLQMVCLGLDAQFGGVPVISEAPKPSVRSSETKPIGPWLVWPALALIVATLNSQILTFALVHSLAEEGFSDVSANALAIFYLGVALASVFCISTGVKLIQGRRGALVEMRLRGEVLQIPLFAVIAASAGFTGLAFLSSENDYRAQLVPLTVLFGAFAFEVVFLSLFDRIGALSKLSGRDGVGLTFGILGAAGCVVLMLLLNLPDLLPGPFGIMAITLAVGCIACRGVYRQNIDVKSAWVKFKKIDRPRNAGAGGVFAGLSNSKPAMNS